MAGSKPPVMVRASLASTETERAFSITASSPAVDSKEIPVGAVPDGAIRMSWAPKNRCSARSSP